MSLLAFAAFLVMAIASKVNHIHTGAFNTNVQVEDKKESGSWIVKNDGTKIKGDKINWKSGLLLKKEVVIDKEKHKSADVRGIMVDHVYYGRMGNEFIKRIVHGKLNVYMQEVSSTSMDSKGIMRQRTSTYHYVQRGEDGPLTPLASKKDILEAIAGCSLSEEMINVKSSKIRKAVRSNRNYMNQVFEIYNNGCKPVN
ncbi:MAG: hypothetical protein JWP69_1468 [Flaviaesturariibacter sp.]|nr:hypothetical protein [Flaviaesturariibacter sp.]